MPLAWAHSEYLKLLRSAADGKVFDRIGIVEERYAGGGGRDTGIEIFQPERRQTRRMIAGKRLRISAAERFMVRWTADGWRTQADVESTQVGYAGSYADLPTAAGQMGTLGFTLYWPEGESSTPASNNGSPGAPGRWEGKNFDVELETA
jgi:glucoamylase